MIKVLKITMNKIYVILTYRKLISEITSTKKISIKTNMMVNIFVKRDLTLENRDYFNRSDRLFILYSPVFVWGSSSMVATFHRIDKILDLISHCINAISLHLDNMFNSIWSDIKFNALKIITVKDNEMTYTKPNRIQPLWLS